MSAYLSTRREEAIAYRHYVTLDRHAAVSKLSPPLSFRLSLGNIGPQSTQIFPILSC